MAKIAIDCDGVLANFTKGYYEMANRIWPGRCDKNYQPNSWNDTQGLSKDEDKQVWERIKAWQNWWMSLDAYSSNVAALMVFLYANKGHDIYIVTSRAPNVGATIAFQTDVWLRACGVQPHANYIAVLPVDNYHNKRAVYKAAQFDFSIDDKKETVEECDTLEGHRAFLLNRNWNQDAVVKNRVTEMGDFFKAVAPSWAG